MKTQRHAAILKIVRTGRVASQEQLRELLKGEGFAVTQATLSRDIRDRKSTRLNSSHDQISYAVFCLKKKKQTIRRSTRSSCSTDSARTGQRPSVTTHAPHSATP